MPIGVSHTYGGTVVVVDLGNGKRFDLTPEMAEASAHECEIIAEAGADGLTVIKALDDRSFRFAGTHEAMAQMAADLRHHAIKARDITKEAQ